MKGRLIDLALGLNGKQRITLEVDADFREKYDALKSSDIRVEIVKYRKPRSKDANAYFHVLVNKIAEAQNLGDDEVKRLLVVDYGAVAREESGEVIGFKLPVSIDVSRIYPYTRIFKQVEEGGKLFNCYLVYKHSSDMDSKEMSRLIDGAIYEAKKLGLETDTPEQIARYKEEWR